MQNPIQKFRQRSIVFEKSVILSEKLKTLVWAPTTIDFKICFWHFVHVSYLTVPTNECLGFFKILFRTCVIYQNKKDLVSQKPDLNKKTKSRRPFCRPW